MTLRDRILTVLAEKGSVRTTEIARRAGVSRAYAHRVLQELQAEGRIVLIGRARSAHYVAGDEGKVTAARAGILRFRRVLKNEGLHEDVILTDIKRETGILHDLPERAARIVDYAFTEILNNAIEHSLSPTIEVSMVRDASRVLFRVLDRGVGIFANLEQKFHLETELDAVQQLLKGKQTTAPHGHTGEGIFFTSRAADHFSIQSGKTLLLFNNYLPDVFVRRQPRSLQGTSVNFTISTDTERVLETLFAEYTDEEFVFNKTEVRVKLYNIGSPYISRSQARRLTAGLEKFETIILDFSEVEMVGQAFADEVFRVWQGRYPHIKIMPEHANEAVTFMIQHARSQA